MKIPVYLFVVIATALAAAGAEVCVSPLFLKNDPVDYA